MKIKKMLPNPFMLANGETITSKMQWEQWRKETKELVLELEYGTMPNAPENVKMDIIKTNKEEGVVVFKKIKFIFYPLKSRTDKFFDLDVSIRYPTPTIINKIKEKVPEFGQNGLPCVIYVGQNSCDELYEAGYIIINYDNVQLEALSQGNPIPGPARNCYQSLFPDMFSWGSISIWAWGGIRMVDFAYTLPEVNKEQIIITGHSRNGKTALLAGALDERIAIVNPAGSGCGGAGSFLVLDEWCEDIASLTDKRRWWAWMHPDFYFYGYNEEKLFFDQHFLMGLVAPRPLLRTEGIMDEWANPKGTAAAFLATEEIYKFFNVADRNQLALRPGGHTQNHEDLLALLSIANWYFFGIPQERVFKDMVCDFNNYPKFMDWKSPNG